MMNKMGKSILTISTSYFHSEKETVKIMGCRYQNLNLQIYSKAMFLLQGKQL